MSIYINDSSRNSHVGSKPAEQKMKVYLAGPMTGLPASNFRVFDVAAAQLRRLGFEVFSPAENDRVLCGWPTGYIPTEEDIKDMNDSGLLTRRQCFEIDMTWICRHADM